MLTYDSFREIVGVATAERSSPVLTPRALNMEFRDGIKPRYGLAHMQTVFEDEADRELFENGVVQKLHPYQPYEERPGGLIVMISGTIFVCYVSGFWLYVKKIFSGLRDDLQIGWAVNAFEWLVVQNGYDKPVIWDGRNPAFQAKPEEGDIPVGGPMCFIHHMIAVGSADGSDKVAISDRWRQTQSDNVWKFSQTPTWDNAGVFGTHADMGKLMSLIPFPQIKNTPNGQGELILMGTNGAQSLNLQLPRDQWIDSQIQDTVLTGVGAASYLGTMSRTSIWFIGQSGLFEFKRIQSNIVRNEALTSESADIQYYWDQSNSNMRLTQPLGYHDNKLLMGLYPQTETSAYGLHRFHKAWASYDLSERWRNGERLPRAWFGIQCAIRPIEWACLLVNRVERTYAISRDVDGKNRIYEQTNHLPYDVKDGKPKTIVSFFDTPPLAGDPKLGLIIKTPDRLRADFDRANGKVEFEVEYRTEESRVWYPWGHDTLEIDNTKCDPLPPYAGTATVPEPEPPCVEVPPTSYRARIRMKGRAEITRVLGALTTTQIAGEGFPPEIMSRCGDTNMVPEGACEKTEIYHI